MKSLLKDAHSSDRDCLEDLQVYFTDCAQPVIDRTHHIKCREVELTYVHIEVESVPFNKGFYTVDLTFFFTVKIAAYTCNAPSNPVELAGIAVFNKKIVLYGSEGNVKVFSTNQCSSECHGQEPNATVQVAEPVCLECRLMDCCNCFCEPLCGMPECICNCIEGNFCGVVPNRAVFVTLGIFYIVSLERSTHIMIPSYDYKIPENCCPDGNCLTDNPCMLFNKMKFPYEEFNPPKLDDLSSD